MSPSERRDALDQAEAATNVVVGRAYDVLDAGERAELVELHPAGPGDGGLSHQLTVGEECLHLGQGRAFVGHGLRTRAAGRRRGAACRCGGPGR